MKYLVWQSGTVFTDLGLYTDLSGILGLLKVCIFCIKGQYFGKNGGINNKIIVASIKLALGGFHLC